MGPISIHAPRVGGDLTILATGLIPAVFQSTPPGWGATVRALTFPSAMGISIHAPRVGGDVVVFDDETT